MNRLFKDSLLYTLGAMLTRSLGIVLIPLYTKYFSVEEYGLLAILMVFVSLFSTLFLFGINSAAIRFYFSDGAEPAERRDMYGTAFLILLIAPPVCALIVTPAFASVAQEVYGIEFFPLFAIVLVISAMKPIERLCAGLLRCQKRALTFVAFFLFLFLTQFAAIYLLVAHFNLGLTGQIYGQLITACLFWVVAIAILLPHVNLKLNRGQAGKLLKFGIPLIPFIIFTWLIAAAPRILLERLAGMSDLAMFALASQFSGILLLLGNASDNALVPHYYETANTKDAAAPLGMLATRFLAIAGLISFAVYVFADDFIYLVADPKFHSAVQYVPLLVLATYLRLSHRVFHWNLMSNEKTRTVSILKGGSFGLLILFIFLLAGWAQLGVWGIIWAMLISDGISLVIGGCVSQWVSRVSYDVPKLAATLVVMLVAVILIAITHSSPGSFAAIFAGMVVTLVAAIATFRCTGLRWSPAGYSLSA